MQMAMNMRALDEICNNKLRARMTHQDTYAPVASSEDDHEASLPSNRNVEDPEDVPTVGANSIDRKSMKPIQISSSPEHEDFEGSVLFTWRYPWFPHVMVSMLLALPLLLGNLYVFSSIVLGALWPAIPFAFHLFLLLAVCKVHMWPKETQERKIVRSIIDLSVMIEIIFFAVVYPRVWGFLVSVFFMDTDGSPVVEWSYARSWFGIFRLLGGSIAVARAVLLGTAIVARRGMAANFLRSVRCASPASSIRIRNILSKVLFVSIFLSGCVLTWCLLSMMRHVLPWSPPTRQEEDCDPLDETECCFPFPSLHHMRRDITSETGWRVNLNSNTMPPAKGGIKINLMRLNELDGFSTMAPLLFYIDGLKEAHEAGLHQLQGPSSIDKSTSSVSVTLLLDVDRKVLLPHSAEIDYLDERHPSVMVFPAKPLKHNARYALAVVNARGADHKRLRPTRGMQRLMADGKNPRRARYMNHLIPALEKAAKWFSYSSDPESLQLMFDFHTASEASQLGKVRSVRDGLISHLDSDAWKWSDHVRTLWVDDLDECPDGLSLTARTIAVEIDVPWFLDCVGPGCRNALLDEAAVASGQTSRVGVAKFFVTIPCSVRAASLGIARSKPLRAILEYGHGLFSTRYEVFDEWLQRLANDEGYVVVGMDWRGMSRFDLLVLANVLLAKPDMLAATRDNMIQGFANKYAMQHFVKHALLEMDFMRFEKRSKKGEQDISLIVPTWENRQPTQVFYGISQGGILGAAYSALSGATNLIDRVVLGVPGTSFSLILTRTRDFQRFAPGVFLLLYTGRQVRTFLTILQMAWDSVEGAGVLGEPFTEKYPRMILQAGLGDIEVPALTAETLARAFNASVLPSHPKEVFGVSVASAATTNNDGPDVTFTELMYQPEFSQLPVDNTMPDMNGVHFCVREDPAMVKQVKEFINTGRVVDTCAPDSCVRDVVRCSFWPRDT